MLVQVCPHGTRASGSHPRLPVTPEQLAADVEACVEFGAEAVHLHPRGDSGWESLEPQDVAAAVAAVRRACPDVPVGVTTGAWIVPDLARRVAVITSWKHLEPPSRPDFASVNLPEPGWEEVASALLDAGIGVEGGVSRSEDVVSLTRSGLAPRLLRLLIEPEPDVADTAVRMADELLTALGPVAPEVPRLVHGREDAAWPVLEWALDRGYDSRIGLEDTLQLPDGAVTPDNAALVAAAFTFLMEPH